MAVIFNGEISGSIVISGSLDVEQISISGNVLAGTDGTSGTSGTEGTSGTAGSSGTSGQDGDLYNTTSTDSFALGNAGTLGVGTSLAYSTAQTILIAYDSENYQESTVSSYDNGTGELIFGSPATTVGSGTYSSWSINLAGASGGDGSSGSSG